MPIRMCITDDDSSGILPVELDSETLAWLAELSRITGAAPQAIVASMLRDIRRDDEAAHDGVHVLLDQLH